MILGRSAAIWPERSTNEITTVTQMMYGRELMHMILLACAKHADVKLAGRSH